MLVDMSREGKSLTQLFQNKNLFDLTKVAAPNCEKSTSTVVVERLSRRLLTAGLSSTSSGGVSKADCGCKVHKTETVFDVGGILEGCDARAKALGYVGVFKATLKQQFKVTKDDCEYVKTINGVDALSVTTHSCGCFSVKHDVGAPAGLTCKNSAGAYVPFFSFQKTTGTSSTGVEFNFQWPKQTPFASQKERAACVVTRLASMSRAADNSGAADVVDCVARKKVTGGPGAEAAAAVASAAAVKGAGAFPQRNMQFGMTLTESDETTVGNVVEARTEELGEGEGVGDMVGTAKVSVYSLTASAWGNARL